MNTTNNLNEGMQCGVVSTCVPSEIAIDWKEPVGYSRYLISSTGVIVFKKNKAFVKVRKHKTSKGTYLVASMAIDELDSKGNLQFKEVYTHTIVCLTMNGPPPSDGLVYEVNHKDGNKHNTHPSNLEWMTRSENVEHAYSTGLRNTSTRTKVIDVTTKTTTMFHSNRALAKFLGVSSGQINHIVREYRKKPFAGKYLFERDYSKREVTKHAWVRDVVALDCVTGEFKLCSDTEQLGYLTNVVPATIRRQLTSLNRNKLLAGYVFRYADDVNDLPTFSVEEAKTSREAYHAKTKPRPKRFGVTVKNYLTNEVRVCKTIIEASQFSTIQKGVINYILQNQEKPRLFRGFSFKYKDDTRPFNEYSLEEIDVSLRKKKSEYPYYKVTNVKTNTTKLYTSVCEFAVLELGRENGKVISNYLKTKSKVPYLDCYVFEPVYL